jgi:hypothetical protein
MKPGRVSVFRETGLLDNDCQLTTVGDTDDPLTQNSRERDVSINDERNGGKHDDRRDSTTSQETVGVSVDSLAGNHRGRLRRLIARTIFITALAMYLANTHLGLKPRGGIVPAAAGSAFSNTMSARTLQKRDNSPTNVCKRWSQQSAIVNGTLYLYGGRATLSSDQKSNQWSTDLSKFVA